MKQQGGIRNFLAQKRKRIWIWAGLSFFILSLLIGGAFWPQRLDIEPGQVASNDIEAPRDMVLVDEEKTQELREQKAQGVANVLEEDEEAREKVLNDINRFFSLIARERNIPFDPEWENDFLSQENIEFWRRVSPDRLNQLKDKLEMVLLIQLDGEVRSTHIEDVKSEIGGQIENLELDQEEEENLIILAQNFIRPNLVLDVEETARRREEARSSVAPVTTSIREGEVLVRQGQVVSEEDLELLQAIGLFHTERDPAHFIGIAGLLALLYWGGFIYINNFHHEIVPKENQMLLICFLPIFMVLLARAVSVLPFEQTGYMFPVALGSILLAVLVNSRIGLFFVPVFALLSSFMFQADFSEFVVGLIGGVAGVYSVSRVSQRRDFIRAGIIVGAFCMAGILVFSLIEGKTELIPLLTRMSLGLTNGIVVAILINGLLPLMENYLGMTSSVRLLELSNPNQPLLKKLLMEAPGTYHHSVIVGNLAEAAADRLGADSLLARVGAYYHDVGKIKRPYFFSENLLGENNPHDKLNPSLSALIIKSHVKDGVELAKKYRLPEPIIDIVQQHHGTSLISYFYQESLEKGGDETTNFIYDGPKPRSKEAALIMLADVAEAAVRSKIAGENPQDLASTIRGLIKEKLEAGQLDECDLTLRDLGPIEECFSKILMGIYHKRVEYPDIGEIKEAEIDAP